MLFLLVLCLCVANGVAYLLTRSPLALACALAGVLLLVWW